MSVFKSDLVNGFAKLGIKESDMVVVHSSLNSFGYVEGGAPTVIESLKEVVGHEGHILMPAFTYRKYIFCMNSPSLAGIVTEYFKDDKDTVRSFHPTHSVAVYGRDKNEIIREHLYNGPFGIGSPWWYVWKMKAKIVLIGVDNTRNSFIHFVERLLELPYKRTVTSMYMGLNGSIRETVINGYPGDDFGFYKLNDLFADCGIIRSCRIGNANIWVMNSIDIVNKLDEILRKNPGYLLCDRDDCVRCHDARNQIKGVRV